MKKITLVLLAILMIASMLFVSSCQLSQVFGKDDETIEDGGEDIKVPIDDGTVYEQMDFLADDFDVTKYITLGNYKGIPVTIEKVELSDEEFEGYLEQMLAEAQYYTEITDRAAAEGDTLNIDFEGYLDGVKFQGGTAAGQTIELSDNSGYIDGFADGLVGVMPGTTVDLDLKFPESYHSTNLAGKAVVFKVKVNYIQGELVTPVLDEAFVKDYTDGEYTDVASFREYIRGVIIQNLEKQAESEAISELYVTIMNGSEVIEYPEQQVNYHKQEALAYYKNAAAYYGIDWETLLAYSGITEESLIETAKEYTKDDLVFAAIVKAEGLFFTEEEYAAEINKYAEEYGITAEEFEEYYTLNYGEDYLMTEMHWDKVAYQLFEWADVTVLE